MNTPTDYELLVLVPGLVSDAAAEQTLDTLAQLRPAPVRITVVDWSHDVHPDVRVAGDPNRHGLARRRSGPLDDLLELADEAWSENLIPHKRIDPVGPPSWCCQCKSKAWAIGEAQKRGSARLLYLQFGDRMTPAAPEALLATLEADPQATFAFLQVYRCRWDGTLSTPPQFVHQEQYVRDVMARHRFMPGTMMAVDRITDTTLLDDRSGWVTQSDDLLTRQILLGGGGHGVGVPRSDAEHLFYYHADPSPMTEVIRRQFTANKKVVPDGDPATARPLMQAVLRESDAAHARHLARRGVADRGSLRIQRVPLNPRFGRTSPPFAKGA